MKSSHSRCRKVQKALLHSRRCYCIAESFTTQQKALLHSRRFYCIVESFTAQQKVLLHIKKFYCTIEDSIAQQKFLPHSKKVSPVAEIGEKFILRQKQRINPLCSVFPWTWTQHLHTNWQRQDGTLEPIPRSARSNFLLRKRNVKRTLNNTFQVFSTKTRCFEIQTRSRGLTGLTENQVLGWFYLSRFNNFSILVKFNIICHDSIISVFW